MKKYECVTFDLDGTLMKSDETIYFTLLESLKILGINASPDKKKFDQMIGWHFKEIFEELSINILDLEEFIDIYKSKYFNYIKDSKLYDGVIEVLKYLKSESIKIALLTTKGQDQADKILQEFNLTGYFDLIVGRRPELKIKPAPDSLIYITNKLGVNPDKTLMVGDTEMDVMCAKNAGADCCAVTFGYRNIDELKKLNPVYIIGSYKEFYGVLK